MRRLFAGIELDDATCALCVDVQQRLQRAAFDAKYEAPEKLHVTLAFLGNVGEEKVASVEDVLAATAASASPFELTLDRVSAFPNERRPRIAFVGSRGGSVPFRSLCDALRERYRRLGFAFNEDAVAHVTIARVKGGSLRALPILELAAHALAVRNIVLFESLPAQNTTRYEVRRRAPFASPPYEEPIDDFENRPYRGIYDDDH